VLYDDRVKNEIRFYENVQNVHDLPEIFHYWSSRHLAPKCVSLDFSDPNNFYIQYIEQIAAQYPGRGCEILSVGAGNCDTEVALAKLLLERNIQNFTFNCLDLNPHMLERGKQIVSENQLQSYFDYLETDINGWKVDQKYQIIIANQSLHHFVELEVLFDKTYDALDDDGYFLSNDMIGRNGHMRWPEALEIILALWATLEDRHKWNHQLNQFEAQYENRDCSTEGFEGIRAQDILPLLIKKFKFHRFLAFSNLINVFVDRSFGPNFDVNNAEDCYFIDFVAKLDDYFIESGKIKPIQMIAAMTRHQSAPVRIYKHLSPEFCIRYST